MSARTARLAAACEQLVDYVMREERLEAVDALLRAVDLGAATDEHRAVLARWVQTELARATRDEESSPLRQPEGHP